MEADSQVKRKWQDYSAIKEEVIGILGSHPEGLTGVKIAEEIGITQGAMSKYLSMLKVDGIITSRSVGVAKLWKLVTVADRTEMLADKMAEDQPATFKDYAVSILEEDSKLYEANGKRVLVMPTSILSGLYKYTKSVLGSQAHAFFYEWGKDYAREVSNLVQELSERTGANFLMSFFLLWKMKGWGRFELVEQKDENLEIIWHDSILSETKDKGPVDDFISGALSNAASHAFGGRWQFEEVECKSTGASFCRFVGVKLPEDLKIIFNDDDHDIMV